MSVSSGYPPEPSTWAVERFGRHAGALAAAVPVQLARAHGKAHAAHLAAGLKKRSPYGVALAGLVRENLADTARELGEAVRDVRGYEYAVINDHALFPFRYADRSRPLDRARLPANASPTRHRLLQAHGPQPPEGLFDIDEDLTTEEYLGLHEAFEELGASTRSPKTPDSAPATCTAHSATAAACAESSTSPSRPASSATAPTAPTASRNEPRDTNTSPPSLPSLAAASTSYGHCSATTAPSPPPHPHSRPPRQLDPAIRTLRTPEYRARHEPW